MTYQGAPNFFKKGEQNLETKLQHMLGFPFSMQASPVI
jgi:hypothetical protein